MAVAYDSSAAIATDATSTANAVVSFTGAGGAVLLVGTLVLGGLSASAVNCNGNLLTQLGGGKHDGNNYIAQLWGLTAPPTGVLSISATIVGGGLGTIWIAGSTFTGARGVNPFGTIITMTAGAVATAGISISSSTTDRVVVMAAGSNNFTITSGATTRFTGLQHQVMRWVDAAGGSPGVSLSSSAVNTSQNLVWLGVNIAASQSAASVYMNLLGAGF